MKDNKASILLNVGFDNYIFIDQIIAIIDFSSTIAKNIVRTARLDKGPRSVINLTKGKRTFSLLILKGDKYVLSTIPRKQLARRLGALMDPKHVSKTENSGKSKEATQSEPNN